MSEEDLAERKEAQPEEVSERLSAAVQTVTMQISNAAGQPVTIELLNKVVEQTDKRMEDLRHHEKQSNNLSKIAIVVSFLAVSFICLQWWEMRKYGNDTHELASSIGKLTDLTKHTASLVEQAGHAVEDNKITSYRELRPYVQVTKLEFIGDVLKGDIIKGKASFTNSGKTPAVNLHGCGDITLKLTSDRMTDNLSCPAPNNPKSRDTREHPRFALGPGASGFIVDGPGTPITLANTSIEDFKQLLSSDIRHIYFYGNIEYSDTIDTKAVHHTTFCGRYDVNTGMLNVCEKHNGMD
jgi:hypothetical protein